MAFWTVLLLGVPALAGSARGQNAEAPFGNEDYREFARIMALTAPQQSDAYLQLQVAVAQSGLTMEAFEALTATDTAKLTNEEKAALAKAQEAADAIQSMLEVHLKEVLKTSHLDLEKLKAINEAYYRSELVRLEIDGFMLEFSK